MLIVASRATSHETYQGHAHKSFNPHTFGPSFPSAVYDCAVLLLQYCIANAVHHLKTNSPVTTALHSTKQTTRERPHEVLARARREHSHPSIHHRDMPDAASNALGGCPKNRHQRLRHPGHCMTPTSFHLQARLDILLENQHSGRDTKSDDCRDRK